MGRPEASVENYLRRRVKETGGRYRKLQWIGRRGAPDQLIWWTWPRVALIECKAPGETIEPGSQQEREINRLLTDAWPVYIVNSREAVDMVIAEVRGVGWQSVC